MKNDLTENKNIIDLVKMPKYHLLTFDGDAMFNNDRGMAIFKTVTGNDYLDAVRQIIRDFQNDREEAAAFFLYDDGDNDCPQCFRTPSCERRHVEGDPVEPWEDFLSRLLLHYEYHPEDLLTDLRYGWQNGLIHCSVLVCDDEPLFQALNIRGVIC